MRFWQDLLETTLEIRRVEEGARLVGRLRRVFGLHERGPDVRRVVADAALALASYEPGAGRKAHPSSRSSVPGSSIRIEARALLEGVKVTVQERPPRASAPLQSVS